MHNRKSECREPAYFPWKYLVDFLEFLQQNRDVIEIITYRDLPWLWDFRYEENYPRERKRWMKQIKRGRRDREKIYVLIQHDVDSCPERTVAILKEEERLGLRVNVMVFNRRTDRKHYEQTGAMTYTDYPLDHEYLRRLEKEKGFVIGYHSNAYEQARFNGDAAQRIFREDVKTLRRYFNVRFFSPHGGSRNGEGQSNNILPIPPALRWSLRWVHNRHTVRFDGQFSDGGINLAGNLPPEKRNLKDFVSTWSPGKRYRVLIHPEYYHGTWTESERMGRAQWYNEMLKFYSSRSCGSLWEDFILHGNDISQEG